MSVSVEVPPLGESISEAIVSRWEVEIGSYVGQDQPLVELETDKITVTVPAPVGGILKEARFEEEDTVEVGQIIAVIEEADAPAGDGGDDDGGDASDGGDDDGGDASDDAGESAAAAASGGDSKPEKREALSPAVQRLVDENNLDPADIPASGPRGHITKGDVLAYLENKKKGGGQKKAAKKADAPQAPARKPAADYDALEERVRMSPLRKRIAERLVQAQQTAAILTTFNEVDMSEVMRLRKTYQDRFVKKYGHKVGFMSFFVKATIEALKAYPAVNAELGDGEIIYKNYYHIGIAVGGGKGLVVPVVRDADQLSFSEVELEIGRLAKKAQGNTLTLDDLTGGTFTISNGGIYGSMLSTPILNPPQVGILGMHNIVERAVVVDGEIVIRPMMYLALSYDHRIIDGREAVSFLVRLKECIENPERMLLEV